MMVFIVLFQLAYALIACKIMTSQKELVWKSDIHDYRLMPFKRCRMYWVSFFIFSITPFIGILSTTDFLFDAFGSDDDMLS